MLPGLSLMNQDGPKKPTAITVLSALHITW